MENVNLKGDKYPSILLALLVELHAKIDAQGNMLIDFLSAVSNKSDEELRESMELRTNAGIKHISDRLYEYFGTLPDDLKDFLSAER